MSLISEAVRLLKEAEIPFSVITPISIRSKEFIIVQSNGGLVVSFNVASKSSFSALVTLVLNQSKFLNLRITDGFYVNENGIKFIGEDADKEYRREITLSVAKELRKVLVIEKMRDEMMMNDKLGLRV